jgi:DNA modification methylase
VIIEPPPVDYPSQKTLPAASIHHIVTMPLTPYYEDQSVTLYHGDNLDVMTQLAAESFVSIVTDPPYGLAFMGKRWDYEVPGVATWEAALQTLKPGGHLLAFAGTRTQHRMAVNIEDAGFEIRDMIAWVYGSGFPKSLDVSKAIDKAAGELGTQSQRANYAGGEHAPRDKSLRSDYGYKYAPATSGAKQWSGYGSALKPALEPITLARKPLDGTLAANTLKHGCGGINVDGCRVEADDLGALQKNWGRVQSVSQGIASTGLKAIDLSNRAPAGRWPANFIHDGSDEVVGMFPQTTSGTKLPHHKRTVPKGKHNFGSGVGGGKLLAPPDGEYFEGDSGSAARFFYCAKASDREILAAESHPLFGESFDAVKNTHPTVKPLALMQWLIRLVTPPGGILLEPFAGSGTTLLAAKTEGRRAVGIEISEEYCETAANRLRNETLH